MLEPIKHILSSKRIVLASGSPRRKDILSNIGLQFDVVPSKFEENLDKSLFKHPSDYVVATAKQKALEVMITLCNKREGQLPDLVVGADTVVTMDGNIYEKPKSKEDAFNMLSSFSGRSHTVFTGVTLITLKPDLVGDQTITEEAVNIATFHEATEVAFASVSSEIIHTYIETGEPMDKAGGYGIQGKGGTLVQSINGDYFNVMGFPLHQFCKHLFIMFNNLEKT